MRWSKLRAAFGAALGATLGIALGAALAPFAASDFFISEICALVCCANVSIASLAGIRDTIARNSAASCPSLRKSPENRLEVVSYAILRTRLLIVSLTSGRAAAFVGLISAMPDYGARQMCLRGRC